MATVRDLITDSLKILGVIGAGGSLSGDHAPDALRITQRMLDAWNAERLTIGTVARSTYTWTADQSSRTIAASGAQLTGARPQWIDRWAVIPAGGTHELAPDEGRVGTREQYAAIPNKAQTADYFTSLFYEPTVPSGTLIVWPVPTTAPTLVLYTPTLITSAVTLDTTLSYAPGYEEALQYQLARRLAPIFTRPWTRELRELAADALRRVKRHNLQIPARKNDRALLGTGGHFDIDGGYYR